MVERLAQGLKGLRFKSLSRHPVVEMSSSLTSSFCCSILATCYWGLLKRERKAQQKQQKNKKNDDANHNAAILYFTNFVLETKNMLFSITSVLTNLTHSLISSAIQGWHCSQLRITGVNNVHRFLQFIVIFWIKLTLLRTLWAGAFTTINQTLLVNILTCWQINVLTCWHIDRLTYWHAEIVT